MYSEFEFKTTNWLLVLNYDQTETFTFITKHATRKGTNTRTHKHTPTPIHTPTYTNIMTHTHLHNNTYISISTIKHCYKVLLIIHLWYHKGIRSSKYR